MNAPLFPTVSIVSPKSCESPCVANVIKSILFVTVVITLKIFNYPISSLFVVAIFLILFGFDSLRLYKKFKLFEDQKNDDYEVWRKKTI